jgi:hypothetical protein
VEGSGLPRAALRPIAGRRRRGRLRRHDRNRRKRWQGCSLCACGGALLLCRTLPRWRNGQIIRVQRGHLRHWRRCIARRSRRVPVVGRIRRGRCRLGSCRRLGGRRRGLRTRLIVHRRQSQNEQPDGDEDSDEQRRLIRLFPGRSGRGHMQATAYFLQFGAVCHAIGVERDHLLVFR